MLLAVNLVLFAINTGLAVYNFDRGRTRLAWLCVCAAVAAALLFVAASFMRR